MIKISVDIVWFWVVKKRRSEIALGVFSFKLTTFKMITFDFMAATDPSAYIELFVKNGISVLLLKV